LKRLATKLSLSGEGLNAAERDIVFHARDLPREQEKTRRIFDGDLGLPPEWSRSFQIAGRTFAKRGVSEADSRRLCWEAVHRCMLVDEHRNGGYVHRAVINAHKRHVRDELESAHEFEELPDGREAEADDLDALIDVHDALADLDADDAEVCRRRVWGEEPFAEIGDGRHRGEVWRQFEKAADGLRRRLSDYAD
jgi:hypothetical protein